MCHKIHLLWWRTSPMKTNQQSFPMVPDHLLRILRRLPVLVKCVFMCCSLNQSVNIIRILYRRNHSGHTPLWDLLLEKRWKLTINEGNAHHPCTQTWIQINSYNERHPFTSHTVRASAPLKVHQTLYTPYRSSAQMLNRTDKPSTQTHWWCVFRILNKRILNAQRLFRQTWEILISVRFRWFRGVSRYSARTPQSLYWPLLSTFMKRSVCRKTETVLSFSQADIVCN